MANDNAMIARLGAIRHRPGMYVGDEVREIVGFLWGFCCGLRFLNRDDTEEVELLHDFGKWLKAKNGDTTTLPWSRLIEAQFRERPDL